MSLHRHFILLLVIATLTGSAPALRAADENASPAPIAATTFAPASASTTTTQTLAVADEQRFIAILKNNPQMQAFDIDPTVTLRTRFLVGDSLRSLSLLQQWWGQVSDLADRRLASRDFKLTTATVKAALPDWESRILGVGNHHASIQGTLLRQQYEIARLRRELADDQLLAHRIDAAQYQAIEQEYLQAREAFEAFLKSYGIAD
jgi:hypothetical protein